MGKILAIFCMVAMSCATYAGLRFDIANTSFPLDNEPVLHKLTPEELAEADGCALFELARGGKTAVPFSIAKLGDSDYIAWNMAGTTEPGAARTFLLERGKPKSDVQTDLGVSDKEGIITVSNLYFTTSHRASGGGSLPSDVRFNLSGNSDNDLCLHDRIATPPAILELLNDGESTAETVFSSPSLAVVEVNAKYVGKNGKDIPDHPHTRYRFFYQSGTPLVKVEMLAEQDSDKGWNELHFLHLTTRFYERNVTGRPAEAFDYLPQGEKSVYRIAEDWGVMEKGPDAVGVGGAKVGCWDSAATEHIYYLRNLSVTKFTGNRIEANGLMYLGQSQRNPSDYSKWLCPAERPRVKVSILKSLDGPRKAMKAEHIFEIGGLRLGFSDARHGFCIMGIEENAGASPRFLEMDSPFMPIWSANFRAGQAEDESIIELNSTNAEGTISQQDNTVTMEWKGIAIGKDEGTVDVRAWVTAEGRGCDWHFSINVHSEKYGLWNSEYPRIGKVFDPTKGSTLLPTGNWGGTLRHNVPCVFNATYPSEKMPVQFMAFMQNGHGLYFGIHDGYAMQKATSLTLKQSLHVNLYAEDMGVPGSGRDDLCPIRMQFFDGDWWHAAKIYREWASHQKWTSRGRMHSNPKFPSSLAKISFWTQITATPEKMLKYMLPLADKVDYPIGLHWYGWTVHRFDTHYPNLRPARENMADAVRQMKEHNIVVMPYINGRIWDTTTDDYAAALPGTCKDWHGKPYMEMYQSSYINLATMCPSTKIYQNAIHDLAFHLFKDQGINSLYLDQIGCATPRLCFDKSHGHKLGGGRYWTEGYRELIRPLREYADTNGYSLTTENTAEPYMDSIDSFLAWGQRQDTDVPVLPAVYSGYTTYFSTPLRDGQDFGASVRTLMGRDFIWGDVVGWNPEWFLTDKYSKELAYALNLGALRYATMDFLAYGELLDEIRPLNDIPRFDVTWFRNSKHKATLPAVQGTVWEAPDGRRGVYVINHLDSVQDIKYALPLPPSGNSWLVRKVTASGNAPLQLTSNRETVRCERLNPNELLVLTIEPYGNQNDALLEEARGVLENSKDTVLRNAAANFLFSSKCGLSLEIAPGINAVSNEFTEIHFAIENSGNAAVAEIAWPNGKTEEFSLQESSRKEFTSRQDFTEIGDGTTSIFISCAGGRYAIPVTIHKVESVFAELKIPEKIYAGEKTQLQLSVTNNSNKTRNANVAISAPVSWGIEPSRTVSVTGLNGGETRTFELSCLVSEQTKDSTDKVKVCVSQECSEENVKVQKTRPRLIASQSTITVDGKLDEWDQENVVTIDGKTPSHVVYKNPKLKYGGSSDCAVQARVAWDSSCLYLAFDVKDNVHISPERSRMIWKGDMIQVEMRPDGPAEKSNDISTSHQFAIAFDEEGGFIYQWGRPEGGEGVQKQASVAFTRGENGNVVYEVAVPWKVLPFGKPEANSKFGFSFVVADNDDSGLKGWLEWTPGIFYMRNPAAFGWLILK